MEFGSQALSFGDFSNLSEEEHEKVFKILHRSRRSRDRKVEFPWDNVDQQSRETVKPADCTQTSGPTLADGELLSGEDHGFTITDTGLKNSPNSAPAEQGFTLPSQHESVELREQGGQIPPANHGITPTHGNAGSSVADGPGYNTAPNPNLAVAVTGPEFSFQHGPSPVSYTVHDHSDSSSSGSARGSTDRSREVTPTDGSEFYAENNNNDKQKGTGRLLASMKTYERRNKKKRPPGYYEKIAQEELFPNMSGRHRQEEYNYMQHNKENPGYHNVPHHMVAPPTSHQPAVITSPVMLPAGGFSGLRGGMVPVFSVPPGYPMPPFQGGVTMPMHPPGVPLLPGHMQQQQHGIMPMPQPPHMTSPVTQTAHIVPMELANTYQRSPVEVRHPPMMSQDVRQHPPGLGPPDRSPHRHAMSQGPKAEPQYNMRRPSPSERLQPDPRDITPGRHSEPRTIQRHNSPPLRVNENMCKDRSSAPGCVIDKDNLTLNTDVKCVPLLTEDKSGHAVLPDSGVVSPERTFEPPGHNESSVDTLEPVTLKNCRNTEPCDNSADEAVCKPVEPKTDFSSGDQLEAPCGPEPSVTVNTYTCKPTDCVKPAESVIPETAVNLETSHLISQEGIQPSDSGKLAGKSKDNQHVNTDVKRKDSDNTDALDVSPTTAPVSVPAPKAQVSWAGLFKETPSAQAPMASPVVTGATNNSAGVVNHSPNTPMVTRDEVKQLVPASEDSAAKQLGELLSNYRPSFEGSPLQPRGLTNRGNWCYVNAILQALLACPALNNLLKKLPNFPALTRGPSSTPILDSLIEFVNEFNPMHLRPVEKIEKGKKRVVTAELVPGSPFEPSNVYKMLQVMESGSSFKGGKQEDAEEFLSFVLNGLHEEMAAAIKQVAQKNNVSENHQEAESDVANGYLDNDGHAPDGEEEDRWEQVGPRNKSAFTRKANFAKTPVSDIFAGQIRSAVFQAGSRESAMLEPFFTLQLDIQSDKVYTVKEALEGLVSKESVQGFTCSKTKAQVEVTRRTTLEELPPVLILHLKFFIYDKSGGCQKLLKKIDYATDLEINRDLLSPNVRSKLPTNQRMYKLFAVVYHHGKNVTGGHYTTDVYHTGINSWIHMDDSNVKQVSLQQVLKFVSPRVPYLLYYRRMDLL